MKLVIQIHRRNGNFKGQKRLGAKKFMSEKHEKIIRKCTIAIMYICSSSYVLPKKTIITIHLQ